MSQGKWKVRKQGLWWWSVIKPDGLIWRYYNSWWSAYEAANALARWEDVR